MRWQGPACNATLHAIAYRRIKRGGRARGPPHGPLPSLLAYRPALTGHVERSLSACLNRSAALKRGSRPLPPPPPSPTPLRAEQAGHRRFCPRAATPAARRDLALSPSSTERAPRLPPLSLPLCRAIHMKEGLGGPLAEARLPHCPPPSATTQSAVVGRARPCNHRPSPPVCSSCPPTPRPMYVCVMDGCMEPSIRLETKRRRAKHETSASADATNRPLPPPAPVPCLLPSLLSSWYVCVCGW